MMSMKTLAKAGIGDLIAFRFFNKTKLTPYNPSPQKDIDTWVCIAKVTNKFEDTDFLGAKRSMGEVYRITKKVQFQVDTLNPSSKIDTYLGIRNDRTKKFECSVDYNINAWELCKIENDKDKIEVMKNIMADVLENGSISENNEDFFLSALPSFQSAPWLNYGRWRGG